MKRVLCLVALLAIVSLVFAGMASAQKISPTIRQQAPSKPGVGVNLIHLNTLQPSYCSPCLFYGGDANPNSPNANGLWDNNSSDFGISGIVYSPVLVQKVKHVHGKSWSVSGVGGNIEMYPSPPSLQGQDWSIVTGVAAGGTPSSTTTICSGTDSAPTATDTGRLFFGFFEEWNVVASTGGTCPGLKLTHKGTMFWQTNPVDTGGGLFQLAYESNISDWPTFPNAFGPPEPSDLSFFYSPAFGFSTFTNTNQLGFFHAFSSDLEGTVQ